MALDKRQAAGGEVVADLDQQGDGKVIVKPADYDAFILTQREAVEALRDHQKMITWVERLKEQIDNLFMDIAAWAKRRPVEAVIWGPRRDEVFFAVIARTEDEGGTLQDELAGFELVLHKKYPFRLSFIMFRSTEAEGVDAFVSAKSARDIYRAPPSSPPGKG